MDFKDVAEQAYKNGYKKGSEETASKIYNKLRGHGTTFVKKWIKENYDIEIERKNDNI